MADDLGWEPMTTVGVERRLHTSSIARRPADCQIRLPWQCPATECRFGQIQFAPNPGAGGSTVRFLITIRYLFLAVVTKYSEMNAVFLLTSERRGRRYTSDVGVQMADCRGRAHVRNITAAPVIGSQSGGTRSTLAPNGIATVVIPVPSQRVGQHRTLADQQITGPVQHQDRLLINALEPARLNQGG